MEPATTAATTAGLVAVIVALARVVEWLIKKYSKNGNTLKLNFDQSRQLREVHEGFLGVKKDIEEVKRDNDKIADAMVHIADAVKKTNETSEKIAYIVEKINRHQEIENEVRRRYSVGPKSIG